MVGRSQDICQEGGMKGCYGILVDTVGENLERGNDPDNDI
jgi:hypothetical protein